MKVIVCLIIIHKLNILLILPLASAEQRKCKLATGYAPFLLLNSNLASEQPLSVFICVCVHMCLSEWLGIVNKKSIVPFKYSASDFISFFSSSALHRDKWLCHSGVSVERGGPFVVNVSACGLAGCWVLGGCEIPSLRNSTLASTPGHHTGSRYKNRAMTYT